MIKEHQIWMTWKHGPVKILSLTENLYGEVSYLGQLINKNRLIKYNASGEQTPWSGEDLDDYDLDYELTKNEWPEYHL